VNANRKPLFRLKKARIEPRPEEPLGSFLNGPAKIESK